QDATASLSTITGLTPPSGSAALPSTGGGTPNKVLITSTGNLITVNSGNTIRGVTLGTATGGVGIFGAGPLGVLTISDISVNNASGGAVNLTNGSLNATFSSISSTGGAHGISLTTTTGSFTVTGDGVSDPTNTTRGRTTAKSGGGT